MSITLSTNVIIQVCGIIVQVGNALSAQQGLLSPKVAIWIGGAVAAAQAIIAYVGHLSTPAGTKIPPQ